MKKPLKDFVIAASGSFGPDRTYEKLKRWVESNGGTWATSITPATTHLVASTDHWKSQSSFVKDALELKTVHIVCWDWLEDCLMTHKHQKERQYLWTGDASEQKQRKKGKSKGKRQKKITRRAVKEFEDGCDNARQDIKSGRSKKSPNLSSRSSSSSSSNGQPPAPQEDVNDKGQGSSSTPASEPASKPRTSVALLAELRARRLERDREEAAAQAAAAPSGNQRKHKRTNAPAPPAGLECHHLYSDATGFMYRVTLTRVCVADNTNERCVLSLYESHALPHTYAMHVSFSGKTAAGLLHPHNTPSPFASSMAATMSTLLSTKATAAEHIPAPIGSSFETAFAAFRAAFKDHTQLAWEERFLPFDELRQRLRRQAACDQIARLEQERAAREAAGEHNGDKKVRGLNSNSDSESEGEGKRKKRKKAKKSGDDGEEDKEKDKQKEKGKELEETNSDDVRVNPFRYIPPPEGRPRGVMPMPGIVVDSIVTTGVIDEKGVGEAGVLASTE